MLNEAQRSYLEAYFIGQYGVLTLIKDGLSAKDALSAFQCLLEMKDKKYDKYTRNKDNFKALGILEFIDQVKKIVEHDAPQNRANNYFEGETDWDYVLYKDENDNAVKETKGILSLTAKNDKTTSPVTKSDVMSYLEAALQAEINLLKKQVEVDELKEQLEQLKKSLAVSSSAPSTVPENPDAKNNNNAIIAADVVTCGITGQIFHTPVSLVGSGKTVEEDVAKKILATNNPVCPYSKQPVTGYDTNWTVKDMVEVYMKANPDADQYKPGTIVTQQVTVPVPPMPASTVSTFVPHSQANSVQNTTSQLTQSRYTVFNSNNNNSSHITYSQFPTQFTLPSLAIVLTEKTLNALNQDTTKATCSVALLGGGSANKCAFSNYIKDEADTIFLSVNSADFTFYNANNIKHQLWNVPPGNFNSIHMRQFINEKNIYLHFDAAQSVRQDVQALLNKLSGISGIKLYQINYNNNKVTMTQIDDIRNHQQEPIVIANKDIYAKLARDVLSQLTQLLPKPASYVEPDSNEVEKSSKCVIQ